MPLEVFHGRQEILVFGRFVPKLEFNVVEEAERFSWIQSCCHLLWLSLIVYFSWSTKVV